jgi:hypothetical protein
VSGAETNAGAVSQELERLAEADSLGSKVPGGGGAYAAGPGVGSGSR